MQITNTYFHQKSISRHYFPRNSMDNILIKQMNKTSSFDLNNKMRKSISSLDGSYKKHKHNQI